MLNIAELKTPGVYIDEVPTFPPSVAAVGTGIPAFIGYTKKAEDVLGRSLDNIPWRISSMNDYVTYFGDAADEAPDAITVNIREWVKEQKKPGAADGDAPELVTVAPPVITVDVKEDKRTKYILYFCLQLYFANGGGPCYIISVGKYGKDIQLGDPSIIDHTNVKYPGFLVGLEALKSEDEPTLIVIPESKYLASVDDYYALQTASLKQCKYMQDRFAIMDVYGKAEDTTISAISQSFRGGISSNPEEVRYGGAYYPELETIYDFNFKEANVSIVHKIRRIKLDGTPAVPDDPGAYDDQKLNGDIINHPDPKKRNSFFYERAKTEITSHTMRLPAAPAIAGIYASVDRDRGVWKAPANVSLANVVKPTVKITDEDQKDMNVDTSSGKSINAIRSFIGKGTLVWGARTLDGNNNDWRYVPVRRLFIMVEESVKKATYQFVFEPNDANTWVRVRAMIENFLTLLWRSGALAGTKPEQAFYVKVGLGQTMSGIDILEGRMIIEIGMAAVRPAEFIVLRFSHKMQEA
ncbi:MAG: phage tail sheath C-terminal domain-containing protein [Ferruginibacter sp.]